MLHKKRDDVFTDKVTRFLNQHYNSMQHPSLYQRDNSCSQNQYTTIIEESQPKCRANQIL